MSNKTAIVEKKYLLTFILITSLFALWGFANDITNPMVATFQTLMEITNAKASLIQFAFYGGYATMAIPAAIFIQRYSYKKGIMLGLTLYAVGALLFWPAAYFQAFGFFLVSLYVLTFGLAFLETTANPFILSLGNKENATRRLNLAQSFNPMGSLMGMFVATQFVLGALISDQQRNSQGDLIFSTLSEAEKANIRLHDLIIIRNPYVILGLLVLFILMVIAFVKMPAVGSSHKIDMKQSFHRLIKNKVYREGVVAQVFYVAVQIMCWTFIIHYADHLGINKESAQKYNIVAMSIFLTSRFISTFLMKYIDSRKLLLWFAIGGALCIAGTILLVNIYGLYCLVATSAFMSLMFPTIYGIALENVGQDKTLGSAGLVLAIVGGAIMPPLQGTLIDKVNVDFLPAVNISFVISFVCFVVIGIYAYRVKIFAGERMDINNQVNRNNQ